MMYPTEVITLPSKGKYYPAGHPLKENGGRLEIKYLTAKEEDILTSTNLIKSGKVFDKLFDSIVVHEGVSHTDLTSGDMVAIIIASRVLAYGKDYPMTITCDKCKHQFDTMVDLTQLETPDEILEPAQDGTHTFDLPVAKVPVTIKCLSRKDEIDIENEVKSISAKKLSDIDQSITSRLRKIIVAIDGNSDRQYIGSAVQNLVMADSSKIKEEFSKMNPTVDLSLEIPCGSETCDNIIKGDLPVTADFFWPNS